MLVLTRKPNERVMIQVDENDPGKTITLQFVRANGKQGVIGIEAPENMKILREELLENYEDEK